MPGLSAFGRRWGIGSDDLVFPIIGENCLRFAWLIAISIVFHINKGTFDCTSGHLLKIYYIGVLTLISASAFINILIIHTSMKGTITNVVPRRRIPLMLYIKLAILLPELAWVIIGTYWAFGKSYDCDRAVVWTVKGAVLFAWVAGFFMIVGILLVFDPLGSKKQKDRFARRMDDRAELVTSDAGVNATKVWEMRCRLLCCCVAFKQDNQGAFNDISKLIADFFQDVDLVPTDIAAGLILVSHQQSCQEQELKSLVIVSPDSHAELDSVQPSTSGQAVCPVPEDWMTIQMMSHFMLYALGSYGWPFFVYNNLATGLCKLAPKCKTSSSQFTMPRFLRPLVHRFRKKPYSPMHIGKPSLYRHGRWYEVLDNDSTDDEESMLCCACMRTSSNVYLDNACECHTAAIRKVTGVSDQDLIYVSFHNKFKEIPFYVAVDREHKSVVISIRGTLSLEDALVDLSAEGMPIEIEGVQDPYVHGAMLDCANYIKSSIENLDLLTKAFSSLPDGSRLVIVGHSLGAGVAAILSILLKPQHPNLICFAFSPPGGLMSPNASRSVQSYVCSVIVGKDLVPRLGMPTMNQLKTKILKALDESKLPKYRILAKGCMKIVCSCIKSDIDLETTSLVENGSSSRYTESQSEGHSEDALREAEMCGGEKQTEWPMHPPGQILHIEEMEESQFCSGPPTYQASWACPDHFAEILISPSMVLDHFPDVVLNSLVQLHERAYVPSTKQQPSIHVAS